jgi:hypothetical protein
MKDRIEVAKSHTSNPPRSRVSSMAAALGMLLVCLVVSPAIAATSLTDSLTGYTGTSQDNFPAQPAFLAGSGLDVSFVWGGGSGAWEKIGFDSSGAIFGSFHSGPEGRNYLRTTDATFAPVNFTAYVTVNRTARETVFFGMGTGALGTGNQPDVGTGNASVFLELQAGYDNGSRRVLGGTPGAPTNVESGYDTMTTVTGPMRLCLAYDATAKTVTFSIDYSPTGPFVADQTFAAVDVSSIASEWAGGEKSSIYFGGQNGMKFTDLVIVAVIPSGALDHFEISAASPQMAGAAFDVTITAKDSGGNTVNDSTTTVTVNSPTAGSLMEFDWNSDGTYGDNSGTLVSGTKTIKARNKKAETVAISAFGGIGTTTTPPDVTTDPDVFVKLQILAPGETATPGTAAGKTGTPISRIANRPFMVSVRAVDANWNLVNSVFDYVDFTSTDSTATLPLPGVGFLLDGTNAFQVTLNTNGNFTLTATNVSNSSIASATVALSSSPVLASAGAWASLPIQPGQTPNIAGWSAVPVASMTNAQGTASWDVKWIKVCNDATNLYFLVELWPGSTVALVSGDVENNFWLDSDNTLATGYANAGESSVGAEDVLRAWQVWSGGVRQTLWWGVTANFSPNANATGPGGNPFGGWQADNGLYYEYSMSLAATNTDGSPVFSTNSVTIGFGSTIKGKMADVIPAFSYTFATSPPPVPANPVAIQISGGSFSFSVTNSSGNYIVQANTNLANPAGWMPVYTNAAPFTFTSSVPVSAAPACFYRTVLQ